MSVDPPTRDEILRLEQALASRHLSAADAARYLAAELLELGQSGRILTRADVLAALETEPPRRVTLSAFRTVDVAPGVVLAAYRAERARSSSLRSSLWVLRNGTWQLLFHQGTPA